MSLDPWDMPPPLWLRLVDTAAKLPPDAPDRAACLRAAAAVRRGEEADRAADIARGMKGPQS